MGVVGDKVVVEFHNFSKTYCSTLNATCFKRNFTHFSFTTFDICTHFVAMSSYCTPTYTSQF